MEGRVGDGEFFGPLPQSQHVTIVFQNLRPTGLGRPGKGDFRGLSAPEATINGYDVEAECAAPIGHVLGLTPDCDQSVLAVVDRPDKLKLVPVRGQHSAGDNLLSPQGGARNRVEGTGEFDGARSRHLAGEDGIVPDDCRRVFGDSPGEFRKLTANGFRPADADHRCQGSTGPFVNGNPAVAITVPSPSMRARGQLVRHLLSRGLEWQHPDLGQAGNDSLRTDIDNGRPVAPDYLVSPADRTDRDFGHLSVKPQKGSQCHYVGGITGGKSHYQGRNSIGANGDVPVGQDHANPVSGLIGQFVKCLMPTVARLSATCWQSAFVSPTSHTVRADVKFISNFAQRAALLIGGYRCLFGGYWNMTVSHSINFNPIVGEI